MRIIVRCNVNKVAQSLIDLIDLIDFLRPSWKLPGYVTRRSLSPHPLVVLDQYAPEFPKDIISWMKEYLLAFRRPPSMGRFILYLFLMFFTFYIDSELVFPTFSINPFSKLAYLVAVVSVICVFIVATYTFGTYNINRNGRIHNSDLLEMAQRTIDYTREYFKEHNIDPKDYPMKLAFNDYKGLYYEKRGKRYLAYLDIE
jgi:hypothetical protein